MCQVSWLSSVSRSPQLPQHATPHFLWIFDWIALWWWYSCYFPIFRECSHQNSLLPSYLRRLHPLRVLKQLQSTRSLVTKRKGSARSLLLSKFIMAEQSTENATSEVENNYSTPANDPKNMQEVTQYVSFF